MKKFLAFVIIFMGIIFLLVLWMIGIFNDLVQKDGEVNGQWAQVQTQYQRRYDLIPNLVESVKGSMAQEEKIFTAIADARTRYSGAANVNDQVSAAVGLESAVSRLLVVMENYPELKSNETVKNMMIQLEGTENRIAVERQRYNEKVQTYNVYITKFPMRIFASMFRFNAKNFFQAAVGAETAPTVNLNTSK